MKIHKDDNVLIRTGKDRGKTGKVIRVFPQRERIIIEGANMHKKHVRPRRRGEKGESVLLPSPLHVSNVQLICPSCSEPTRVGYTQNEGSKARVCKQCGNAIV